jgi:hypothetical protein
MHLNFNKFALSFIFNSAPYGFQSVICHYLCYAALPAAGGGDGTLNEVVAAMMAHREAVAQLGMSVALLPLGTANDFACTAGISVVRPVRRCWATWLVATGYNCCFVLHCAPAHLLAVTCCPMLWQILAAAALSTAA